MGTTSGIAYIDDNMSMHSLADPIVSLKYIYDLDTDLTGGGIGITLDGDILTIQDLEVSKYYDSYKLGLSKPISVLIETTAVRYISVRKTTILSRSELIWTLITMKRYRQIL